jgi:hypothetical protein
MMVWEKEFRLGSEGHMYQVDDWLLQIQVFFPNIFFVYYAIVARDAFIQWHSQSPTVPIISSSFLGPLLRPCGSKAAAAG